VVPATVIGEAVPVTVFATPPLLDVQVAVYCGAVSALPLFAPPVKVTVSGPVVVVVDPDFALLRANPRSPRRKPPKPGSSPTRWST
jgi:hypothetical protein